MFGLFCRVAVKSQRSERSILGSISSVQQPSARRGGLSAFELYIPILISFSIGVLALTYLPGPLVSYREQGILRRLSTTPVPAFWVLAAQFVVQACLMLIAVFLLIGVSVAGYGAIAPRNPGGWAVTSGHFNPKPACAISAARISSSV